MRLGLHRTFRACLVAPGLGALSVMPGAAADAGGPAAELRQLLRQRREVAGRAYEIGVQCWESGSWGLEDLFHLARLRNEAEIDAAESPAQADAARRKFVEIVREADRRLGFMIDAGLRAPADRFLSQYWIAMAEIASRQVDRPAGSAGRPPPDPELTQWLEERRNLAVKVRDFARKKWDVGRVDFTYYFQSECSLREAQLDLAMTPGGRRATNEIFLVEIRRLEQRVAQSFANDVVAPRDAALARHGLLLARVDLLRADNLYGETDSTTFAARTAELRKLCAEKFEVITRVFGYEREALKSGASGFPRILHSARLLFAAEMDLATSPTQRVAAAENASKIARELETTAQRMAAEQTAPEGDRLYCECWRLWAETEVLKARQEEGGGAALPKAGAGR